MVRGAKLALMFSVVVCACKDDPLPHGTPPPPSGQSSTAACAGGGGQVADALSAPFLPRTVAGFCLDPHGDEKTYGEKGKLQIGELCTTALDGGCEEYKRFGVTRSVIVHYVANAGPASVEVFLSRFAGDGAYAIYTTRLTGEADPTDEHAARKLPDVTSLPAASGAMGTGKAYAERGSYFLELTYTNDQETPDQLKKSSDVILTALAKAIASTLPQTPDVPASAKALPQADLVPNGVMYFDKDLLGVPNAGAGAVGYFKSAKPKRYRMVSAVREGVEPAKDLIHLLRGQPGALPVANLGDDAVEVVLQASPERAKIDWIIARKGPNVMGVGDEEFASEDASLRLTKDEKIAKLRSELK